MRANHAAVTCAMSEMSMPPARQPTPAEGSPSEAIAPMSRRPRLDEAALQDPTRRNQVRNALQVVLTAPEVLAADPLSAPQRAMVERLRRAGVTLARACNAAPDTSP